MGRTRTMLACGECGHRVPQWVGRCPSCGSWGTVRAAVGGGDGPGAPVCLLGDPPRDEPRVSTGIAGLDRVFGGGLVPASVTLLAGEPGIGKSTLLLQLLGHLSAAGRSCLLASGEESHAQVAARARRLGVPADAVAFAPGRDLPAVLGAARERRPSLLAVDSIQALRDPTGTQMPGGVAQVRSCTDALVGLAKDEGVAVVMTGHVTKDGDLAGPRALEHAVDVVLGFQGDAGSGMRVLTCGKNRFGAEGEAAWFEMGPSGLREIDAADLLLSGEPNPGSAVALPLAGRRALAVEVQALAGSTDGPARRQTTGLDGRRFQLVAAVLSRLGYPTARTELFGASSGGIRIDDPACDLAVAAALASAIAEVPSPEGAAFVGEVALTGRIRPAPGMPQRFAAAAAAGRRSVFAAAGSSPPRGLEVVPVRHISDALDWARPRARRLHRAAS